MKKETTERERKPRKKGTTKYTKKRDREFHTQELAELRHECLNLSRFPFVYFVYFVVPIPVFIEFVVPIPVFMYFVVPFYHFVVFGLVGMSWASVVSRAVPRRSRRMILPSGSTR